MSVNTISKALALTNIKAIFFAILLGIVIIVPAFLHSQWITGPLVNAVLIIAAMLIGPMEAVFLGLMPSTVALSVGLPPLALAPMVPFIMISNALFIGIIYYFRKKGFVIGILIAAFIKFAFLHESVTLIMRRLLQKDWVAKLAVMMSWPQFFTAIIGGFIAYILLKNLKKI